MSEWYDSQKKPCSNLRKLLQERLNKTNPRHKLTAEESKCLNKLTAIADKLKRGENVQNRQLQTWLSKDESAQIELEWLEQLELREELKDKPSDLQRYEEKLKQATLTKRFPKTWPKARGPRGPAHDLLSDREQTRRVTSKSVTGP